MHNPFLTITAIVIALSSYCNAQSLSSWQFSQSFMNSMMNQAIPGYSTYNNLLRQYSSLQNQANSISSQGGYAEYLKKQKMREMELKLAAERRKLTCKVNCRDEADLNLPGFCREVRSNRQCESGMFKYTQCAFTCGGCTKCPPGYTPPTRAPKTTTPPPTTTATAEPVVERSIDENGHVFECTEEKLPCSNKKSRGCGRWFLYKNCKQKRTQTNCQKHCGLCKTKTVCKNVTEEVLAERAAEIAESVVEAASNKTANETAAVEESVNEGNTAKTSEEEDTVKESAPSKNPFSPFTRKSEGEKSGEGEPARVQKKVDCNPECKDENTDCAVMMERDSSFCTNVWNLSRKRCRASCNECQNPCPSS